MLIQVLITASLENTAGVLRHRSRPGLERGGCGGTPLGYLLLPRSHYL